MDNQDIKSTISKVPKFIHLNLSFLFQSLSHFQIHYALYHLSVVIASPLAPITLVLTLFHSRCSRYFTPLLSIHSHTPLPFQSRKQNFPVPYVCYSTHHILISTPFSPSSIYFQYESFYTDG